MKTMVQHSSKVFRMLGGVASLCLVACNDSALPTQLSNDDAALAHSVGFAGNPGTPSSGFKPPKGAQRGRLAFSNGHVVTMLPDGSQLVDLGEGYDPSWSPDGERLAFWRGAATSGGIYVMNADGSHIAQVSPNGYQPTWSPDGERLAFSCGGICVINVDGTNRRAITVPELDGTGCLRDSDPSWSPDGHTIAFTRWPAVAIPSSSCLPAGLTMSFPFDFWTEVWFVNADGSSLRALKNDNGINVTYAAWPAWSPDGQKLAFFYAGVGFNSIAVVNADGTGFHEVRRKSPVDWVEFLGGPDWSPDGSRLVLGSAANWGYASAAGPTITRDFTSPFRLPSNWAVWSWSRR